MKLVFLSLISSLFATATTMYGQAIKLDRDKLVPNQVSMSFERMMGKEALKVVKDSTIQKVDEPTFVRLNGVDFTNGTIEVKVLSRLLKNAPETARGFIGIAFRINEANSSYESIYIRPTNGRVILGMHARTDNPELLKAQELGIKIYSYPDYKFDRLRKEAPERYESYADMALNEWITMKIVVNGPEAKLYLNNAKQPALLVKDLKHGAGTATADGSGGIGLWVDVGTEGYFSDLIITKQ
ncbi:MAG: hypothetical protein EOO39_39230 [Cytophagaceae bacterium]|nr:MAG: hypothetical protein EOO39_39230 [Cytophagaceae bacterium]